MCKGTDSCSGNFRRINPIFAIRLLPFSLQVPQIAYHSLDTVTVMHRYELWDILQLSISACVFLYLMVCIDAPVSRMCLYCVRNRAVTRLNVLTLSELDRLISGNVVGTCTKCHLRVLWLVETEWFGMILAFIITMITFLVRKERKRS
jgi:hypothetical protein